MCCMKSRSKHFLVIHPHFPFDSTCFFRTTCWIFRISFYITLLLLLKLNKFTIVLKASSTNLMNMEITAKPKSQTLEKIGLWTRNPTPYTLHPTPQPLKYAVGKICSIQGKIPLVWDLIQHADCIRRIRAGLEIPLRSDVSGFSNLHCSGVHRLDQFWLRAMTRCVAWVQHRIITNSSELNEMKKSCGQCRMPRLAISGWALHLYAFFTLLVRSKVKRESLQSTSHELNNFPTNWQNMSTCWWLGKHCSGVHRLEGSGMQRR